MMRVNIQEVAAVSFLLLFFVSRRTTECAICEENHVGLETSLIPDSRFSSSSSNNKYTHAQQARLNNFKSWCARDNDTSQYLEIDLGSTHVICGLSSQGDPTSDRWVQAYSVSFSTDRASWTKYRENGYVKEFAANYDRNSIVKVLVKELLVTRFIRILPVYTYTLPCLRLEIYGTKGCVNSTVGVARRAATPDARFTATSSYKGYYRYKPFQARLNGRYGWLPNTHAQSEYVQVDIGQVFALCAIATQGSGYTGYFEDWTTIYKMRYSMDMIHWSYYQEGAVDKEFDGNKDKYTVHKNSLPYLVEAKFIRLHSIASQGDPAFRIELYGAQKACTAALGMESRAIANNQITASSTSFRPYNGRLYGSSIWCSSAQNTNQYLQVDLQSTKRISGIATQGNANSIKWVTSYALAYKLARSTTWRAYKLEGDKTFTIFQGNKDKKNVVVAWLPYVLNARYMRVVPQTWRGAICIRMDLHGCNIAQRPSSKLYPVKARLHPLPGSHVTIQCDVTSQPDIVLVWKDSNGNVIEPASSVTYPSNGAVNGLTRSIYRLNFANITDTLSTYSCKRVSLQSRELVCRNEIYCVAFYSSLESETKIQKTSTIKVVLLVPGVPQNLHARDIEARSVRLSWLNPVPHPSESPLLQLILHYSNSTFTMLPTTTRKQLNGLLPYTNYTVRVRATSEVGQGQEAVIHLTTDTALPEDAPSGTTVVAISSTSLQVSWKRPERINGPLRGYRIIYRSKGQNQITHDVSGHVTNFTIGNLQKWTDYEVEVRVYNDKGESPPGRIHRLRTLEDVPTAAPSSFLVKATGPTSVRLTWKLPPQGARNGIVRGFHLRYNIVPIYRNAWLRDISGNTTLSEDIIRLKKYTKYWFWVRAVTIGQGINSRPLAVVTEQDAPSAPLDFRAFVLPPEPDLSPGLSLAWKLPADKNGIIQRYTLYYREKQAGYKELMKTLGANENCTVIRIYGGAIYDVALTASTIKQGPRAVVRDVLIPEYKPTAAPAALFVREYNETSFNITWQPLSRGESNGCIRAYEVKSSLKGRLTRRDVQENNRLVNTTSTYLVLGDLMLCTRYAVSVRAFTGAGAGPYSDEIEKGTSEPSAPSELKVLSTGKTSITLKWLPPHLLNGDVKFYTIHYNGSKNYNLSFHDSNSVDAPGVVTEFKVRDLTPSTSYTFHISATSKCGEGRSRIPTTTNTLVDVPKPPKVKAALFKNITSESANVTLWPASDINGPISHYEVIVLGVTKEIFILPDDYSAHLTDFNTAHEKDIPYYITAQLEASQLKAPSTFLVGDMKEYGLYLNMKLTKEKVFMVYERAIAATGQGILLGEHALVATLYLAHDSQSGIGLPSTSEGSTIYIIAGVCALVFVVLVLFGLAVYISRRRRRRAKQEEEEHLESEAIGMAKLSTAERTACGNPDYEDTNPLALVNVGSVKDDENEESSIASGSFVEDKSADSHLAVPSGPSSYRESGVYSEPVEVESTEIPIDQYLEFFKRAKAHKFARLNDEYKKLPAGQQCSWNAAKNHKDKNRYANIIAYDHSRVILKTSTDGKDADYINASYLNGYDGSTKKYIATQGPTTTSFDDFWRMIWQVESAVIVMLTNLKESGKVKCHQYWPGMTKVYREIIVTLHSTEIFADYTKRTFFLSKKQCSDKRQVVQFQFTVWPDKGVPQHPTAVLGFRKKVNGQNPHGAGPIVVHCSAGVGRTGAYVAIDAMLERALKEKKVDIYSYVKNIRKNRIHMVQTDEQYVFVHKAILEATICGNTAIMTQALTRTMQKLSAVIPGREITGYADEFQRLHLISSEVLQDDSNVAQSPQNVSKNRGSDYLPLDSSRVILSSSKQGMDYINASFADAYKERNMFIMTQAPLLGTIADFWRMILQYKAGTVVMLNNIEESTEKYPEYWPTEHAEIYGNILVEPLSVDICGDFTMRRMKVSSYTEKEHLIVRHFHFPNWPDKCVPANHQSVLELVNEVQRSQQQSKGANPIVVQCSNGASRSGVFCAIYSVLERLKLEQVVDVFQVIKVLRTKRLQSVISLTQYVYCYQIAQKYLDNFSDYANFTPMT